MTSSFPPSISSSAFFLPSGHKRKRSCDDLGITKDRVYGVLTEIRGSQRVTDQNPEDKYQSLEKYGRDLTDRAREGKLDPVLGRDEEIRRVIQVLLAAPRTIRC